MFRAVLFFTLDQKRHTNRQRAYNFLIGSARFDKGHDLTLIIRRSACADNLASVLKRRDNRLKGRRVPQI